jgi:hypothetical protein
VKPDSLHGHTPLILHPTMFSWCSNSSMKVERLAGLSGTYHTSGPLPQRTPSPSTFACCLVRAHETCGPEVDRPNVEEGPPETNTCIALAEEIIHGGFVTCGDPVWIRMLDEYLGSTVAAS